MFAANAYREYLEVHGLSVQLTEALAEFWHQRIRSELTFPDGTSAATDDPQDIEKYFDLAYRGARYSFGYPACPDLTEQTKVVQLLEPSRIGVELSEEYQLHPEQSTTAIVCHRLRVSTAQGNPTQNHRLNISAIVSMRKARP